MSGTPADSPTSSSGHGASLGDARYIDLPQPPAPPRPLWRRLTLFARDIKIAHTVFAMPFALLATFMAGRQYGREPLIGKLVLILTCMVTARTFAMAANRLIDATLDAANPRTARRAIPAGSLSRAFVSTMAGLCAAAFVLSAALFWVFYANPWPVLLSLPVLLFLAGYPFMKRFTRLCHFYLGAALALAPVCAWIAVTASIDWPPALMAAAVLTWTAGFDIIYACQDYDIDVRDGLFSVPAKLGLGPALWVARLTHVVSASMLVLLTWWCWPVLGWFFAAGVAMTVGLLIVEHCLVKPNDLSRVGHAFFTINGLISLLLGALGVLDLFL